MRYRLLISAAAGAALVTSAWAGEESRRDLDSHVHGEGALSIAIEGRSIAIELEAPAADIVGFEHKARSPEQKEAVERAKSKLAMSLDLLKLPSAAGCRQTESHVELEGGGGEAGGEEPGHDGAEAHEEHDGHEAEHSGFRAEYALECEHPEALTGLEATYFVVFERAKALEVNVVSEKAQSRFRLTREAPALDLSGVM